MSRFGERFRDGQYSLVSFLFAVLLLTVPRPVPSHLQSGGTCPPYPMESAPLRATVSFQLNSLVSYTYARKLLRDVVVAPFLRLTVVVVALSNINYDKSHFFVKYKAFS